MREFEQGHYGDSQIFVPGFEGEGFQQLFCVLPWRSAATAAEESRTNPNLPVPKARDLRLWLLRRRRRNQDR